MRTLLEPVRRRMHYYMDASYDILLKGSGLRTIARPSWASCCSAAPSAASACSASAVSSTECAAADAALRSSRAQPAPPLLI